MDNKGKGLGVHEQRMVEPMKVKDRPFDARLGIGQGECSHAMDATDMDTVFIAWHGRHGIQRCQNDSLDSHCRLEVISKNIHDHHVLQAFNEGPINVLPQVVFKSWCIKQ